MLWSGVFWDVVGELGVYFCVLNSCIDVESWMRLCVLTSRLVGHCNDYCRQVELSLASSSHTRSAPALSKKLKLSF